MDSECIIKQSCVSNLFIRQMHFLKYGDFMCGHKHVHSHQTLLAYGKFEIIVEGVRSYYEAPNVIKIEKGLVHTIIARSDNAVAYCIHPLRTGEKEEDIADPEYVPANVADITFD